MAASAPVLYFGETATQPAALDLPIVPDDKWWQCDAGSRQMGWIRKLRRI